MALVVVLSSISRGSDVNCASDKNLVWSYNLSKLRVHIRLDCSSLPIKSVKATSSPEIGVKPVQNFSCLLSDCTKFPYLFISKASMKNIFKTEFIFPSSSNYFPISEFNKNCWQASRNKILFNDQLSDRSNSLYSMRN